MASGNPIPSTSWTKNGVTVVRTSRYKIVNNRYLKIKRVIASDSGRYVCVARNAYGMVNATIELVVKGEYVLRK